MMCEKAMMDLPKDAAKAGVTTCHGSSGLVWFDESAPVSIKEWSFIRSRLATPTRPRQKRGNGRRLVDMVFGKKAVK